MSAAAGTASASDPLHVYIVVGEESGDQLGASLMRALREQHSGPIRFSGVGGEAMEREGMTSLFALSEIVAFGVVQIVAGLPRILRRIADVSVDILAKQPDVLVIVDSPDFTHRVARRVRARAPKIPIIDYVSPSVWAWRPGRARAMRRYIDHVLALLPFEPQAHRELGGPPCTYVGHPLSEQIATLRPNAEEQARRDTKPPVLLVLPGSRRGEIARLSGPFGEALNLLATRGISTEIVLPTVPHVHAQVNEAVRNWRQRPRIVLDAAEKRAAFRSARAALAASGTVTLELALAGVPTVAAYRVAPLEAWIARRLIRVPTVILANLVLGENVVPEFLQEQCTPAALAGALVPLLGDTPERERQCDAFARLDGVMEIATARPSERAA
ncbi:MAG: lipid-A-disaccharide synthase, partial [Rhizobiales bacterium]|nr:lipid-A-disaccharide synthase [Hyphomicrobiales bacterium]